MGTNIVTGNSRSKLINVLRARGSGPADGSSKTKMLGFMEGTVAMVIHFYPPTIIRREELSI
jgi:hypothetical protein